ncbi:DedA family protein [Pengzhenrongella sicca]|uniref:DedA family protein n=1 Tax=Pengzhenrongella sicca TaxID=2819238 RepID=A0A8A4ZI07_9MICO|nr:DedA family protein [Pengzhenrongella sicca]QTE29258.1 DedA family protein [Pengzhenrongella sicca]
MDGLLEFALASAAHPWVYPVVFAWVVIDAFFPPIPSDVVVVGLAALSISAGVPNTWGIAIVAALGAIVGDNIAYELGRRLGVERWRWLRGRAAQRAIASARTSLLRRPVVLMLTARYVPIGRVAVTMVAGAIGFPRRRFVPLTVLAGLTWSAYMVGVGVLAGTWAQDHPVLSLVVAIAFAIAFGVLADRLVARFQARRDLATVVVGAAPLPESELEPTAALDRDLTPARACSPR